MKIPSLGSFSLVGGTALALRYGHRSSEDLDLFSNEKFIHDAMISALEKEFGSLFNYRRQHVQFGIFCFVIMRHPKKQLETLNII